MRCHPANMTASLVTRTRRTNIGVLAKVSGSIQELCTQPRVHAMETSAPSPFTSHQLDILTQFLPKIESTLSKISDSRDAASLYTENESVTIIGYTETMSRNVSQGVNIP
nr:hypothetical transcript [Hymenolepis microstoma]